MNNDFWKDLIDKSTPSSAMEWAFVLTWLLIIIVPLTLEVALTIAGAMFEPRTLKMAVIDPSVITFAQWSGGIVTTGKLINSGIRKIADGSPTPEVKT